MIKIFHLNVVKFLVMFQIFNFNILKFLVMIQIFNLNILKFLVVIKIFDIVLKSKIPNVVCRSDGAHCKGGGRTCVVSHYVGAKTSCSLCLLEVIHLCGRHLFDVVFTKLRLVL